MKIKWGIDTGYVINIPDFELEIPDEDLEDLSEEEQNKIIDEYVQDEFDNRMYTYWKRVD